MDIFIKILSIACFAAYFAAACVLTYLLLGKMKPFKAHSLSEEQMEAIRQNGIIHITTEKAASAILKDHALFASKGLYHNYSNPDTESCFFFINQNLADLNLRFNVDTKSNVGVTIQDITEDQLNEFLVRDYDNAILHAGTFCTEQSNQWASAPLTGTYKMHFPVSYLVHALGAAAVSFLASALFFTLTIFLISLI